jgi:Cys-tRNA synthase (O-phospho-L-seryl-tRNA:Cys-tRNA synthase)
LSFCPHFVNDTAQGITISARITRYIRLWAVEVFYRDIKQTMAMDILRCKSPAMIDKEVVMHAIAGR